MCVCGEGAKAAEVRREGERRAKKGGSQICEGWMECLEFVVVDYLVEN